MSEPGLLSFPCEFPIKVMGLTREGYAQAIVGVVQRHAPDFDPSTLQIHFADPD